MYQKLCEIIRNYNSFMITTHEYPDGDGLGSEIALYYFLKHMGKSVRIINSSSTRKYQFLDPEEVIELYSKEHLEEEYFPEVLVILDCSSLERIGKVKELALKLDKTLSVCVDHHKFLGSFADLSIVNEKASSVGEMIYSVIASMSGQGTIAIDAQIALGLYISIMTDTGRFSYSNTTPYVFYIVQQLLNTGIDPSMIFEYVYEKNTKGQIQLLGKALQNMELYCDNRLAVISVSREWFDEYGVDPVEADYFIEIARTIDTAKIVIFFEEIMPNEILINFRSKHFINVEKIAKKFGGGGHKYSSGATVSGDLEEIRKSILKYVIGLIESLEQ